MAEENGNDVSADADPDTGQYGEHADADDLGQVSIAVRIEIAATQFYAALLANPAVTGLGDPPAGSDQYRIDTPPVGIAVAMAENLIAQVENRDDLKITRTDSEDSGG